MSGRIFQNVVLQLKENTDRTVGVIDGEGVVIACSELSMIGQRWSEYVAAVNGAAGSMVCFDGKTFKALSGWGNQFDYAVFAFGDNEISKTICSMATVALNAAKSYYEEKHDRGSFVKDVVLIRQLPDGAGSKELNKTAAQIEEALRVNGESTVVVGMGTIAMHLRDLAKSYKEAQIAIEVGKVFDTEKYIINYENLGIGRLIYQLPTTLCEMFLQEVFKKNPIDALDKETLFTIHKFFENNLNVSETARKLFVHRNTLVYRLEKIKKLTGLDLREFDDAITFKVALMVKKYLTSRGIDS